MPRANPEQANSRAEFYAQIPEFWADLGGREYALFDLHHISEIEAAAMRKCAADVGAIYGRLAPLLRSLDDDTLLELGYPASTLSLARDVWPLPELLVARVDMIGGPDGFRAIECNADTPAFVMETHRINALVCAAFGARDPNSGAEDTLRAALKSAIRTALAEIEGTGHDRPYVVFAAYRAANEDRETTRYQRELALDAAWDCSFVPLDELRVDLSGLYDVSGRRIDVLYRLWPIEFFARESDPRDGAPIGRMLFDLVLRRKLAIVNPPSGFLLQNKAVQAVAWGLYERNEFFTTDECAAIERSFLPTYLDPPAAGAFVAKPALGREGASIDIAGSGFGASSIDRSFDAVPKVYQTYRELPLIEATTVAGRRSLHALHTCFLIGGIPTALGMRAGGPITDNAAFFVPLGY